MIEEAVYDIDVLAEFLDSYIGLLNEFKSALFGSDRYSKFCTIHSKLKSDAKDHNCLECNLNNILLYVKSQLYQSVGNDRIEHLYYHNIMAMYLAVERIDTIFNVIKLNDEYRKKHFKGFAQIRKWANFIKHPKAFMLCHHPSFTFRGFSFNSELLKHYYVIIDDSFILKYYSNDDKNEKLFKELQNKELVLVVFPNFEKLLLKFTTECLKFIEIIETNLVYKEILMDRTTFTNYYHVETD